MNDEKMMEVLRSVVDDVSIVLVFFTTIMVLGSCEPLMLGIMYNCTLLSYTVKLVFDGILKDTKGMAFDGFLYAINFLLMLYQLFNI